MVSVRPVRAEDRERLREWRNLPEVSRYMYTDHHIAEEEHAAWFARMMEDRTCQYWVVEAEGRDVGVICLTNIDLRHGRAGGGLYLGDTALRGRGIGCSMLFLLMEQAFEVHRLHRLCCQEMAFNEGTIRMTERFGFKVEGVLRQHARKEGRFVDVICLGVLSDEWAANRDQLARLARIRKRDS